MAPLALQACAGPPGVGVAGAGSEAGAQVGEVDPATFAVVSPAGVKRPPFAFSAEDEALLDQVQRGAFNFLWNAVGKTGMVVDRTSVTIVSVAGVGFQLSAIPIGVERGWITRQQGEARALQILRALEANPDNRRKGLFYHFVDGDTAGQPAQAYEKVVSTIDSALFFAGALTAGSYFGGEVRAIGDRLFDEADWSSVMAYEGVATTSGPPQPHEVGMMSLAWKPDDIAQPRGSGRIKPFYWLDAGDEQRLCLFLAVSATRAEHRVQARDYYRLRRMLGTETFADGTVVPPHFWFPYSGALFTHVFAHCWIDYSAIGPDAPSKHVELPRVSIDWWENTRRAVALQRAKRAQNPKAPSALGEHAWGLTAMDADGAYIVPGVYPAVRVPVKGERDGFDFTSYRAADDWRDGTFAPYGPGMAIMFEPEASLAALRAFKGLKNEKGEPLVWRDAASTAEKPGGGWGFRDSFNLHTGWVAPDCVAIDQGPLILAIENARTGLVWEWFHRHPAVAGGMERLTLKRSGRGEEAR